MTSAFILMSVLHLYGDLQSEGGLLPQGGAAAPAALPTSPLLVTSSSCRLETDYLAEILDGSVLGPLHLFVPCIILWE